uniref:MT domain-containing protein n=1 Tax=Schistosoma mansoni TaxID=6183 RepID=A0A5K4F7S1_SCHMA
MEIVEVINEINKDYIMSDVEKKLSLRSVFMQVLAGDCITLWEDLYSFVTSNVDFIRSVKDEAEFRYFVNRSMRNLQLLLGKKSGYISSSSTIRLKNIFTELSETFSHVLSTNSNTVYDTESVTTPLLSSWHCGVSNFQSILSFKDGKSISVDNGKIKSIQSSLFSLLGREDHSLENLLRKIPFGNSKYRALNEYIKNLSSNTSEISSKGIENMRPNNGFDAIAYFSVCREIGVYEFMYFIRKNLESRNTSPYDLEPILRPKNDEPHYIFSTFGILVAAGTEQEHLSLTQWFSEAVLYEALIKILTFRYLPAWKSFFTWRQIMRRRKFKRISNILSNNCLLASSVYVRLFQVVQKLFDSLDTLKFFPNIMCPLNMVQFCAQINRNVRYNTILMSHITNCICIALKFARHALAKLIRYKEDELNWNSKEINQTTSMTETWKKGLIVKNDLEHLRKQLNSFPNVLHCIRYRLASSLLHKFQSSIQNYIYDELNLSSMEQRDIERENVKEDITEKNFRLVIYPILLKQSEEESQLLLWPLPSTIITIFNLTFEQFKESLHLNKTISEHELTQIYFNEEKEIENISEIIDNPIDVNSIIEAFYNNSSSVDLNDSKHSMNIPWNIINPIGLEATNMNIRDMVHCYLPTYGDFEKGLIPEHQPHQNQSILSRMDLDQSHLNISGYNCFPTIENASQMGLHSLIEQQCEAMKLYDCLITSWNKRIYEKTNNTIQSLQWIIKMNETINELSVLLKNEDLHTELHKHQRLFELSFQWINNVVHHIKYESLLNNHEDNRLNCFIIIDYNPLFNLLYHEIIEKLSKLFSIFITIVDNSLISISNQLDDFIQIHANIPSDFNGFIQIVTYLNRVHNDYEKLFKDHDNLCRQVEFLQHIQKCSNNYTELKFIQFIQWSNYEQFLIKWKKFINQIEWARKKFQRYQDEFYQVYNQKVEETIKEVERLVHLLTTGKYSDVNNDAQMILNDMKEPYCYVIKLESFIHQLVNQYQIVEKCKQNEKQFQKGKIEKLNVSPSNKSFIKTTITSYDNTIHITKDCQGNYKLKYFNETNNVLLHIDNEIKKINCRYDAWQLNLKIVTFKQELYKSNLGEISLNMFNEKYQKLVSLCNNLRNDDVIIQYNMKWLNKMKLLIKLLNYILDTNLLSFSSEYWNHCSKLFNLSFTINWKDCTVNDLMKNPKYNLLKQKYKLKEIWQIFQYLSLIQQIKTTIETQFKSLNIQFITMKSHSALIKSVHSSFRNEYMNQMNQWLYLYRLNLLKQNNEEGNDSQFTILTNNYVHLVNDPLLNDQVISIQSIEWDNNEFIQLNYINLQLFIEIMNCKWNLWLTLKDDLYENVSMFEKSIDEMCETFPLFCLLSKMEMIELLSNWSIPYCDYAAPLKCSVDDFIDPKQNSYQSYLNTNLTNCGLVNLNKWIKRLFPYLLDCVMVWCKAEKCWKITGVINEFHQHIELLHSLRWIPSISQWFKQFNSTLQLTFLKMTLNSLLEIENNHQWINELIREKQLVPVIILELTIRIASWQQLEKVIIKEDRENEFIEIIPIFNSEINDSFSNESNEYNDIPTIGIKQFSKIHLYKWDNQSLLMNNNTLYIPLLNTSQELIQLGSALNNHEFGLLIGSFGTGKQTIIRQLAFLLGRRLIEFSSNIFNDTFENKLKNDILSCTRIGGLFSIMNMHFEDFIKNLQQSIENIDRNSHKLITYHCNQYISDSQQCLFNQNVRIDYSFGLFGTYDSRKFQNLSKVQKLSFRNVTIGPPNYSFIIQCLFKYYLPEYQSHSIIPRLVNLLNRSLTHFTNESDPNYKQMNNYYLSFSMIIKSFELAKQFWLEKLNHIQEIRQRTALKSSMILRKEEDKLAEAAIIYGLTKVYRINLSIHSIQDNPIKILFQSSSDFNGLATIEQCLSINSVLPLMYNNEEFLECDNSMYPKVSWEFIHRLLREIYVRNLEIVSSQLIKIIELWQLINVNRPILIIGSVGSVPNEENNNNQEITIDSLNLKQNIKIFNIPDSLNSYLNKFNLISTNSRSKQFDIYNKIISLKHFFPYSNEHLTSYFINDHNMTELDVDISSIFEEWLLLDLSDQSIEHLTFLNDDNILNLLKVVKNLKFTRKLFIEKTTINDLSPGFIHQFSILSTEVINNNELNWLHLWRIWCKQSYLSYMVINSIWDKILNELDHYIPLVLDQTWEFINQWCHKDEDDTSGLINIKSYKNIFCQQSIKNSLALMSELLNKYFPRELWELRKNAIKPSSVYQSNLTLIDYYWSEWRNIEDQPVFYETLIRNLFLFSFIWGIGGGLAGDPRLKSRFETIILRILKDFIRLPNSLNIDSIDNASSSTLSIESYYANQIHSISSSIEWNNNNNNSNHEQQCEDMKELQYSLFNCLVDLRTGYFTPFWYTDCLQLHWPEEYDIINPKENNYHTKSFLPTLFHLTVHLFTGSLFIQSGRPVIISGPFGSGKSQLAIAISRDSEQSKQLIDSYNNKKKKRTSLVRIQSTDFLHRIISNSQKTSSQYQKHTSDEKINLMHNIIILEDVHLISKTAATQRIWNQELRNQLTTCNPNHNTLNYSKSKYNFIPILTSLDDNHQTIQLHCPTKLNSLMYQFAYINLTDPCLLFVKEMNIDGFHQEQNIYGFSPISLLCQSMMCHGLSRISGMLVERFSWIIWYMHCALMKERCTYDNTKVDWLIMHKIAYSMGYHLRNYYPCESTNEITSNSSIVSDNINRHIYSRWTPLLLSESIHVNSKNQLGNILQSVMFLCQEIKRYFSPLLPKGLCSEWLFNTLSRSFDYYLIKPSSLGLLVPISYLLFGPAGSLFLDSKFTRQSILHLNIHSSTKLTDTSLSVVSQRVCNESGFSINSTSSSSSSVSCLTLTTSFSYSSCYSSKVTSSSIPTTSITNNSFSTQSFNTFSTSAQYNSNSYTSSNYSTTSVSTSSSDSLVYGTSLTSMPILSSSMLSLSNSRIDTVMTTTTTTTTTTSLVNSLFTPPTISTSTFSTSLLTNQLSNMSLQEAEQEEKEEEKQIISNESISNHDNNINYEFSTQIEQLCSKLNDETETSLSSYKRPIYSPFYEKYNRKCDKNHRSWAKYGLLNPHLVPCISLPGCLDQTNDLEAIFVNLKNDLSICDIEINGYDSVLQYMIRNAMNLIYNTLIHNPCYILLTNSTDYKTCGINFYIQKHIIQLIIKLKNYNKIYYTKYLKHENENFWNHFKQYEIIIIDLSNYNDHQSFHDDDDDDGDEDKADDMNMLLLLIQRLQELRFNLPWNGMSDDKVKGIFVIASTDDIIYNQLKQYISWDCVIHFNESMNNLQLMNLEYKTITNNIDFDQKSILKNFLFNHYLLNSNHGNNNNNNNNHYSILYDLFIEAYLLVCQFNDINQDITWINKSIIINNQYSLNYLLQTINVWYYLQYYHNKQNKNYILRNQLNETNLLYNSMNNSYVSLENQMNEMNSIIELMRKDLHDYEEIYLPEAKLSCTNINEHLQFLENEILNKEYELVNMKKPMDHVKKLAEKEFNKLKNAYRLAVEGLHNLSIEDLDEIRSYREPPDDVKNCVYLICMLMDEEENWETAKHMMVPVEFISRILKLSTQSLNKHKHRELRKRLNHSEILTYENLLQVSVAAARLCQWLRALCECCDAGERLQNHINDYSSVEAQVSQSESILGNLHLSLQLTKINIEMANNHLIECEHQIKRLSENINILDYKMNEAKALASTIQSNLSELYNDTSNHDTTKNLSFWFNILGALGTEFYHQTMNDTNEDLIIYEKCFQNLQLFKIIQTNPYELMKYFTLNKQFPQELILLYNNQHITYILEAILSICTILWSVRYAYTIQYDNNKKKTNVDESMLYMFIYDPDQIGINIIRLLLLTNNDNDESDNISSSKKDQLICDLHIDEKEFISNFNYAIHTNKIIFINLDQFHNFNAKKNIHYLMRFYFNQIFDKNIFNTKNSQIILWTTFSQYTNIGSKCRHKFCQIDLISINLALSHLECGSVLTSCLLNLLPNCEVLKSFQKLRINEIEAFEKICEDKIQLLNISNKLINYKLFHSDIKKSLSNTNSIQFNVCLNLTKQHIELIQIFSRLSSNSMHFKEIQLQCKHLYNQLNMFIYQNNTIGCIINFTCKISLLFSSFDDIPNEDYITFRWPCKRLCEYIMSSKQTNLYSSHLEDMNEVDSPSDVLISHEHEIQETSRCIVHTLLEFFFSSLNTWNNPLGLIIQIKLSIYFNILQYTKLTIDELQNPDQINEIELFKQIIFSNIFSCEYDYQHCFNHNKSEVLRRIQLLEKKLPTLNGLEKAIMNEPLIWTEIVETKPNFFHSLPGFSTKLSIPESHVFLVWISIRPELFHIISKVFVNHILAQHITSTNNNNKEHSSRSFEAEKRLRIDELFQPQIMKRVQGSYSNENDLSSSVIYLILPNELNEFKHKDFLVNYMSGKVVVSNELINALNKMAMYSNRTLFSIDCANTTDISYWLSVCGSNTNILPYQRILIVLQNVHIIDKRMDTLLDELLQYGLYNLRYKQIHHLQNQEKPLLINKLGICFDIIIDFTCCTSGKQIVSVYNRLPGWLRLKCLPLLFQYENDKSLFTTSSWKVTSLVNKKEKPICYSQETVNESINEGNSQLWLEESDGLYEKIESDKLYECMYNIEDMDKRKQWIDTIWATIEKELKILETIFKQLELRYLSTSSSSAAAATATASSLSLSIKKTSPTFLLTTQYYAYLRSMKYYHHQYTKKYTSNNYKLFIWLKRQLLISKQFCKLMNSWNIKKSIGLTLPASIIVNPKSLFDWVIYSTSNSSMEQYQIISTIQKPGDKEIFKNGIIITSIRLIIHRNPKKHIHNHMENNSNSLLKTTKVINLQLTTIPIETFNKMNYINAIWIESWPPNENEIYPKIPLLLTNYDKLSKIYIITDYHL